MSEENQPLIKNFDQKRYDTSARPEDVFIAPSFLGEKGNVSPLFKDSQRCPRITYTWSDINVFADMKNQNNGSNDPWYKFSRGNNRVDKRKHILKNVYGVANPGELLAILGSSGAGKTTLLNSLTFRSSRGVTTTGLRCINGTPVTSDVLISQSAYVQQDDLFIGCLTVKEHLRFQALVRMDKHIPYQQRMRRVEEVISELGLTKCENTRIGIPGRIKGISGGEMKRLSFASEVLTNPSMMFCDEPTSGLDSFMAQNVIQVLKGLAQTGKTVVCTIHQPSSEIYAMFDKMLLMAEGKVAFMGTSEEASMFFEHIGAPCPNNYNPADYFIQLLAVVPSRESSCKQSVDMICDNFEKSDIGTRLKQEASSIAKTEWNYDEVWQSAELVRTPYKASWCAQFNALLWRSWLSVMKEPMLIKVRLFQTTLVSLLIGVIYFHQKVDKDGVMNMNGALFIYLTNMTFQNVFAVINVFCIELPIFMREHKNGMYRTDVYFLSKTIAEAPLFVFLPILFTSISYYMIGFNPEIIKFANAVLIVTLVANVSTSFGYLISCASTNINMALSVGPPVIIPFLLFGGFFLNAGSVPVYFEWLSYLSWFKYGNEALLINQWEDVTQIACSSLNSTCPENGHVVLESLNFKESNFMFDILCLGILIVGFRLAAFLSLLAKTYTR